MLALAALALLVQVLLLMLSAMAMSGADGLKIRVRDLEAAQDEDHTLLERLQVRLAAAETELARRVSAPVPVVAAPSVPAVEAVPTPVVEAMPAVEAVPTPVVETKPEIEAAPAPTVEALPIVEPMPTAVPVLEVTPDVEAMPLPPVEVAPPPAIAPAPAAAAAPDSPEPKAAPQKAPPKAAPQKAPPMPAPSLATPHRPPRRPTPGHAEPPPLAGPPSPPRPPVPSATTTPPPQAPALDLEALGMRLFSWIAGVALVLGAVFFLKYSVEQGWLGPPVRMALGLATGLALVGVRELRRARDYRVTANAMAAAGIAILFATLYAAHERWFLLSQATTFVLMSLVTAAAALQAMRHKTIGLAILGMLGGFATPALLSTGENRPVVLFGYLLILNTGLGWLALRQRWPVLSVASLGLTFLYQWGWVFRFLDAAHVPLAMGIFLAFPLVATLLQAMHGTRREGGDARDVLFPDMPNVSTAMLSALVPLLFSLYLAAMPAFAARPALLLGFHAIVAIGLAAVAATEKQGALHLIGGLATALVLGLLVTTSYVPGSYGALVTGTLALMAVYLLAEPAAARLGRPMDLIGRGGSTCAALFMLVFPVLALVEPRTGSPLLLFGPLFLALAGVAALAVLRRAPVAYYVAALFAVATEATWSAAHLSPERLLSALAVYGGFALFYLGVPALAQALGRPIAMRGGATALLFASLGLLLFLATGPTAPHALWGIALLLLVLNAGLFREDRATGSVLRMAPALLFSWVVLGVWWASAGVSALLLGPALLVIALFAMASLAFSLFLPAAAGDGAAEAPRSVPQVALVSYLFLLAVAVQPSLLVPLMPLLATLGLLALAMIAATLYAGRPEIHAIATVATQAVLVAVALASPQPGTSTTTLLCSAAAAALAMAVVPAALRRGLPEDALAALRMTAIGSIGLTCAHAIVVATMRDRPSLPLIATVVAIATTALLEKARRSGWHELAPLAVLPPGITSLVVANRHEDPWHTLAFHAALWLPFIVHPIWMGARMGRRIHPALAAVLASVAFLLLGRTEMLRLGLEPVLGALPLGIALVMCGLLRRLLDIEPAGARTRGRLVLVSAAALGFATAALPMQLDREWLTIALALEVVALSWLQGRLPHPGLKVAIALVGGAVMTRLCLNPAVMTYHVRSLVPIWNWYLYTYVVPALAFYAAARLLWHAARRHHPGEPEAPGSTFPALHQLLTASATLLLFLLLNIEIADFWAPRDVPVLTFDLGAGLAQNLSYTIGWAVFATLMLGAGIAARSRATRLASLLLLSLTIVKGFGHDLRTLNELYRVASFVGMAACLALVAVMLQRFVLRRPVESAA